MTNTARAARALLAGFALASLLACFAPAGQAGTAEAPEIVDPANDHVLSPAGQALLGLGEACDAGAPCFNRDDILAVWFDQDKATSFNVNILLANAPVSATQYVVQYDFRATGADAEVVSTVTTTAAEPALGGNVASAAVDGNTLVLTINKDIYGAATGLTGVSVLARARFIAPSPGNVELSRDRAPDADGIAYTFSPGGGGNATNGTLDTDNDGLNDTKEIQQFGNISAQNGTGDPDGDGLNNSAEFNLGTNATLADTDGDGLDDGEDSAPLDPNQPALTNTTDRDNDTLPDLWEREHFNNTAAQNATGDPDADGLNNSAEFQQGTDPNVADTDGDGHDDAEDGAPLDPDSTGHDHDDGLAARPELYSGAAMFAAAATFCLLGLARLL